MPVRSDSAATRSTCSEQPTALASAAGARVEFLAGTIPISVEVVGWYRVTEDSSEILRYRLEDLAAAEPGVIPALYRLSLAPGSDAEVVGSALAGRIAALGAVAVRKIATRLAADLVRGE